MSDQPIPRPGWSTVQQPANVYYFRPYSFYWPGAFIFIGAFGCSGLTGTLDRGSSILLWTVYTVGVLVIMLIDPLCIFEQKQVDENECSFIVRRPLVGFRSCEQTVPLEVLERGLCRTVDGEDQPRLRDGYRYGPAFWRI
ncbi:uncharacterized protein N7498_010602 [Penicillium cinerascens]|uniref:Uncharacterized protein n=1 Tax=Penicillium cinerascens TaxID=70096 RepID=A0A9W9M928_9EURO|nr:uncharacterized protein N7498_010602 [Penicillium cinerascens]KAJ5191617.1 hypothetical protein N7498_010602 [Penicillium cinerascens]